jgi:microcystin-dependent protein
MSGTIPLSMTQQCDQYGDPLAGGQLYFIVAGTVSTPQNAYQDIGLTLPWPNPISLDAAGRVPQLFLADGLIKIRLTDKNGVVQLVADNVQVIGPSSGGGGGSAIDPTTIAQTGDLKPRYGVGAHTGWVRCNALTIGSAISGATERANADCQALFQYLWAIDPNLAVSSGRGATALADWNANKTLTLPDGRDRTFAGMGDMGNIAAGRLTAFTSTVLGAAGGEGSHLLATTELPAHGHGITDPGHTHTSTNNGGAATVPLAIGGSTTAISVNSGALNITIAPATTGITVNAAGGGLTHNNTQPTIVATIYIKL